MWMEEGIYHVLESTNQSGSKMTAALASCGNGRCSGRAKIATTGRGK